jgi:DNA-binding CsgD family transcriptional regulator
MATSKGAHDSFLLGSVIESLYEAALDPALMPQALHAYARAFNGTGAVALAISDHQGRTVCSPDLFEAGEAYAAEWWKHDFLTLRGDERKVRGIFSDLDLATDEERASHPFYQEFRRPFGCFWLCAQTVSLPGASPLVITIQRSEEFGPFLQPELEQVAPTGRHASRAFDIAAKLAEAANQSAALCDALTQLGYGVIGLGNTGRAQFTNWVADRLMMDGLRVSNGAVLASHSDDQRALDGLVSQTLALASGQSPAPPKPVALRRPSGRVPIVLYGIPIAERHKDLLTLLGGRPRALLVVIEPDAARQLDEQLLRQLFGLTPGEARLAAAIATGTTMNEAAARFGVSEATTRVVLKHVFQKVGVSRQAELVLLLAPLLRHL